MSRAKHADAPAAVSTFVELKIGAAVLYTGPAGNGPYHGEIVSVGDPDYAPVGIRVTKPSGIAFTIGAELGDGPGTFALVD